jgi:HlyD family secretion protein
MVAVILVVLGAAAGGAAYYATHGAADSATRFRTVAIKRGDLLSTISATGTVEPEEVVDVGAQVMGLIVEFGDDPHHPAKFIDYGSVVEKGTLLAKIDPTPYKAALEQAEATLQKSEADQKQLEAKSRQAEQEWKRAKSLIPQKAIADTDYDTALANHEVAKANVAAGVATIRQNKASVDTAQINLGYCTIKSPVRGTILDRRVNIGQTVVASLNAPSLFLIAKDLKKMQVWASVNEADIGHIRLGMPVRFTVDAYAGETFRGTVTQIRMNATMTQNVVTYTVVVTTDNSSGKLLPYLTANVQFEIGRRSDVLVAPNAALRWKPQASQIDPEVGNAVSLASFEKDGETGNSPSAKLPHDTDSAKSANSPDHGWVWVLANGGFVRPLKVLVGASDGMMTEVSGIGVKEGVRVVAGEEGKEDAENEEPAGGEKTSNPFLPKPPKGSRPPPPM